MFQFEQHIYLLLIYRILTYYLCLDLSHTYFVSLENHVTSVGQPELYEKLNNSNNISLVIYNHIFSVPCIICNLLIDTIYTHTSMHNGNAG